MTDDELTTAFERIANAMRSAGLEWTLTQVQEEIRFGRRATKRIKATTDTPSAVVTFANEAQRRRKTVSFAATRPLTPQERLELLISAIEQVIVATHDMEVVIRDRVKRISVIRFQKEWKYSGDIRQLENNGVFVVTAAKTEPTPMEAVVLEDVLKGLAAEAMDHDAKGREVDVFYRVQVRIKKQPKGKGDATT